MVFRLEVFLADGWIELLDVERDEAEVSFVFDRSEPVDYGCGVFPLVEAAFFRDCAVDAVEDLFADFAYTYIHTYNLYLYTIKMSKLTSMWGRVLIKYINTKRRFRGMLEWARERCIGMNCEVGAHYVC